jgi:vacuolar protein sorting-associated protein 13A/C
VELTKLLFRVSHQDVLLLSELLDRIRKGLAAPIENVPLPVAQSRPNLSEQFRVSFESIQALLIDDLSDLHMPLFEFGLEKTIFEMSNWSSTLEFNLGLSLFANYFNAKNSHWEPMIESSQVSVNGQNEAEGKRAITIFCRKKLEINVTHTLVETVLVLMEKFNSSEVCYSLTVETNRLAIGKQKSLRGQKSHWVSYCYLD